ncbi:MAG: hypothetical protein AVDCRST_MAG25-384, partial [uncultured Rubrobacteraceae bacterium]
ASRWNLGWRGARPPLARSIEGEGLRVGRREHGVPPGGRV